MKYLKFNVIILSLVILLPVRTFAIDLPKDLPTIEALIALHKAIKKDEDKALQRVATSFGEQSVITKERTSSTMCGLPLTRGSTMYIPIWYWQEPFLPPPTRFICW